MPLNMTMQGRAALGRKLRALPDRVQKPVQDAVVAGAEQIARMARALVPVDDGDLRDSIHVTKPGERTPPHSQPGGEREARQFEAIVTAGGTNARHAALVEYGTAPHEAGGQFKGADHPGTEAQPYFWPAVRIERRKVRAKVGRTIRKAIKAEFER